VIVVGLLVAVEACPALPASFTASTVVCQDNVNPTDCLCLGCFWSTADMACYKPAALGNAATFHMSPVAQNPTTLRCIQQQKVNAVSFRAWHGGQPDPALLTNLAAATSAGISHIQLVFDLDKSRIDLTRGNLYITETAFDQMKAAVDWLITHKCNFETLWVNLLDPTLWFSDEQHNVHTLTGLLFGTTNGKITWMVNDSPPSYTWSYGSWTGTFRIQSGELTSVSSWSAIFGTLLPTDLQEFFDHFTSSQPAAFPLWYQGTTSSSFADFQPFAIWSSPDAKLLSNVILPPAAVCGGGFGGGFAKVWTV